MDGTNGSVSGVDTGRVRFHSVDLSPVRGGKGLVLRSTLCPDAKSLPLSKSSPSSTSSSTSSWNGRPFATPGTGLGPTLTLLTLDESGTGEGRDGEGKTLKGPSKESFTK